MFPWYSNTLNIQVCVRKNKPNSFPEKKTLAGVNYCTFRIDCFRKNDYWRVYGVKMQIIILCKDMLN